MLAARHVMISVSDGAVELAGAACSEQYAACSEQSGSLLFLFYFQLVLGGAGLDRPMAVYKLMICESLNAFCETRLMFCSILLRSVLRRVG